MFKTIHQNSIMNISTGAMTSGIPDTVSGLRQVLFLFLHFYFLVQSVNEEKWLVSYSINLKIC